MGALPGGTEEGIERDIHARRAARQRSRTAGGRGDRRFVELTHKEACVQFLALRRGVLWDLRTGNIIEIMIRSGDESR